MRFTKALPALLFCVGGLALGSDLRDSGALLQSVDSERSTYLEVTDARVVARDSEGARRTFRLRRSETVASVAETVDGWVAVGSIRRTRRDRTLFVMHQESAAGYRRFPGPKTGKRAMLLGAQPLVEDGRLAGLAWLQGDGPGSAAVRTADWTGVRWSRSKTVAPPAAGSQTGLTGTVLDDGAWLLVWTAYDGEDDELRWALRSGSSWSEPRGLTAENSVPDITPTVIAVPGGALVAWSRLEDDQYRLFLSRFERGSWTRPREISGAGSVYPRLTRQAGGLSLLLKRAFPASWTVLDLDDRGTVRRRALFAAVPAARPVLQRRAGGEARLLWAGARGATEAGWEPLP